MIKTNIKMKVTPEQSRRVQEICFENGIYWAGENKNKVRVYSNFLYIRGLITHDTLNNFTYFKEAEAEEINADFFIRTNGTCEETFESLCNDFIDENMKPSKSSQLYNEKYTSQPKNLESALKKIENLHIALNKKVEKIKNQALEINKLLEQKKDLQEINDTQNIYIKNLENDLDNLNKSVFTNSNILNDYIRELETKVNKLEAKSKIDTKWIAHQKTIEENLNRIVSEIGTKQRLEAIEHKKQLKEKDTIISYLEGRLK